MHRTRSDVFWGDPGIKGRDSLIICSSTCSAITIEYFSVQYNALDRGVKFSGTTAALRQSSQFHAVFRQMRRRA
jgi:hypothetical protein